jgi:ATP-dependent DNA helicase RecG
MTWPGRQKTPNAARGLSERELLTEVALRGLVWHDRASGDYYATAAGVVLLAKDPSLVFPQCRLLADAYRSTEADGDPRDHEDTRAPMPAAIERAVAFSGRARSPVVVVRLSSR